MTAHLRADRPEAVEDLGTTLGRQLRRRRRELDLCQAEAAKLLRVNWKTLMWWERDERPPQASAYPTIVEFLGREPWPQPKTLADALVAERRRRGVTICQAAVLIGVDEGTWRRWESGEWKPTSITLSRIDRFLRIDTKVAFAKEVR